MNPERRRIIHSREQAQSLLAPWVFAIFACAIAFTLFYLFAIRGRALLPAVLSSLFVLGALFALVVALRRTVERVKFGKVTITLEPPLPALGGELQARIRLPRAAMHARGLNAEIVCTDVSFTVDARSGKNVRHVRRVWHHEHRFPVPLGGRVDIRLPVADEPFIQRGKAYEWELRIEADVPGVDLGRSFPIDVAQRRRDAPAHPSTPAGAHFDDSRPVEPEAARLSAPSATEPTSPRLALIAANLLPLGGAIYLGWNLTDFILLYWLENIVVGVFALLRIAAARRDNLEVISIGDAGAGGHEYLLAKALLLGFFVLHYGAFCFAQGELLLRLFLAGGAGDAGNDASVILAGLLGQPWFLVALGGLLVSHGLSFLRNYLQGGECGNVNAQQLMLQPYLRIWATQLFIIAGGLLLQQYHSPLAALMLFIVIKTAIDLYLHQRERAALSQETE